MYYIFIYNIYNSNIHTSIYSLTYKIIYKIIYIHIIIYIFYSLLRKVFRCGPVSMFMKLQSIWTQLSLKDIAAKVYI